MGLLVDGVLALEKLCPHPSPSNLVLLSDRHLIQGHSVPSKPTRLGHRHRKIKASGLGDIAGGALEMKHVILHVLACLHPLARRPCRLEHECDGRGSSYGPAGNGGPTLGCWS